MSDESIEDLANYIVKEIEREDFFCAMKKYGGFVIQTTSKNLANWWDKL